MPRPTASRLTAADLYAAFPLRRRFRTGAAWNALVAGYGFVLPALLLAFWRLATDPLANVGPFFWAETAFVGLVMVGVFFAAVEPLAWVLRAVPGAHALAVWLVAWVALAVLDAGGTVDLRELDLPLPVLAAPCALVGALRWSLYEHKRRRIAGARVADVFD